MEIKNELSRFILEELNQTGRSSFDDDDDLLAEGVIDSVGLVQLVAFIDQQFGIITAPEDLIPENFQNLNAITNLISSKRGDRIV